MSAVEIHPFRVKQQLDRGAIEDIIGSIRLDCVISLLDAEAVFGPSHVLSGYLHAARAIRRGSDRARERSVEVLRWMGASRQVGEGLRQVGPVEDTRRLLISCVDGNWPGPEDEGTSSKIAVIWGSDLNVPAELLEPITLEDVTGPEDIWGGRTALGRLGIESWEGIREEEAELAVLERIATAELR